MCGLTEPLHCYHLPGEYSPSIISPLVTPDMSSIYPLAIDRSLSLIQKDNKIGIVGQINSTPVSVSAKFAAWRDATTTAQGKINFEGGLCDIGEECPILLKYLELDIADFKIRRPTIFARDVHIRNAKMYTPNPILGTRKSDGKIQFPSAKLLLMGTVNGNKKVVFREFENNLSGSMRLVKDIVRGRYTISNFYISGRFNSEKFRVSTRIQVNILSSDLLPNVKKFSNCGGGPIARPCLSFTLSDQYLNSEH